MSSKDQGPIEQAFKRSKTALNDDIANQIAFDIDFIVERDLRPYIEGFGEPGMQRKTNVFDKKKVVYEIMTHMQEYKSESLKKANELINSMAVQGMDRTLDLKLVFFAKKQSLDVLFTNSLECCIFLQMYYLCIYGETKEEYMTFWDQAFDVVESLEANEECDSLNCFFTKKHVYKREYKDIFIALLVDMYERSKQLFTKTFKAYIKEFYLHEDIMQVEPSPVAKASSPPPPSDSCRPLELTLLDNYPSITFQEMSRPGRVRMESNIFSGIEIAICDIPDIANNTSVTGGIVNKLIQRMLKVEKELNPSLRCIHASDPGFQGYLESSQGDMGTVIMNLHEITTKLSLRTKDDAYFSRIVIPVDEQFHFFTIVCKMTGERQYDVFVIESLYKAHKKQQIVSILKPLSNLGTFTLKREEDLGVTIGKQKECQCGYFTALNCISFIQDRPFTVTVNMTINLCRHVVAAIFEKEETKLSALIDRCKRPEVTAEYMKEKIFSGKTMKSLQEYNAFFDSFGQARSYSETFAPTQMNDDGRGVLYKDDCYQTLRKFVDKYEAERAKREINEEDYIQIFNEFYHPFKMTMELVRPFYDIVNSLFSRFFKHINRTEQSFKDAMVMFKLAHDIRGYGNSKFMISRNGDLNKDF